MRRGGGVFPVKSHVINASAKRHTGMKKTKTNYAAGLAGISLFAIMAMIIIVPSYSLAQTGSNAPGSAQYCPGQGSDPYSYLCSASATYLKKQSISFTLNQSRIPLFIGSQEHPWKVEDASGTVIYAPKSKSPKTQPPASFAFTDAWDQKNDAGKYVRPGTYSIVFPNMPYVIQPLTVEVIKKAKDKK